MLLHFNNFRDSSDNLNLPAPEAVRSMTTIDAFGGFAVSSNISTSNWNHRIRKRRRVKPCVTTTMVMSSWTVTGLSLIHISEPTRLLSISYAVFCLKKKKKHTKHHIIHCPLSVSQSNHTITNIIV
eukprot:TRINITY_DN31517_c0_g1_i1.p1 TRINITY_DN31517_c0_g1~~TRINITY_DN31517_c0_g1_i1.p1  ORF type:complete len:126 (-),score=12.30 TRINITY_DN31517_c0_g1_i1:12-389(-)